MVLIEIPSLSSSSGSSPTVYLKVAVFESEKLRNVAYSVDVPTVKTSRGVPETVTDSEKVTVKAGTLPGM